MKYLAILKDSVREALDSKVLYVLIGFSCLGILLTAGISFKPESAQKGWVDIIHRFAGNPFPFQLTEPGLQYDVIDVRQLEDKAQEPWNGEHEFTLIAIEQKKLGFRVFVWLWTLEAQDHEASNEDLSARKRLMDLRNSAENIPVEQIETFLNKKLEEEIQKVSDRQMERFFADQILAHSSFQPISIKRITEPAPRSSEFRFNVHVRASPATYRVWPHELTFFAYPTGYITTVGQQVFRIEHSIIGDIGAGVALLVSIIITAFFITNLVRKGSVDLLISKPIRRWVLLTYKFIGGLTFMFVSTFVIVAGIWFVLAWKSGIWAPAFLLAVIILTFEFAIFYSVSTLCGVMTQSPIVSILAGCLTWVILFVVGWSYPVVKELRQIDMGPKWLEPTVSAIHFILPRYEDIDFLNKELLSRDLLGPESPQRKQIEKRVSDIHWGESIGFSTAFIALMLGLACWRFAVKDY